ncbi:hypothetical protein CYMTET_2781 [Cymbomonas tetramitiformis]|uniref:Ankyrin repeat protein n=1 Tax=Cymbomonas tetramitiformis TaxID=36881 RepID=A0AAE0H4L0_9CHLO|nr:hypothetical protein CYMTET_2781 [Cymbomonas tetramitiformis]
MNFDELWWFVHTFDLRLTEIELTLLKMTCRAARVTLKAHRTLRPSELVSSLNMVRWTIASASPRYAIEIKEFWQDEILRLDRPDLLPVLEVLETPLDRQLLPHLAAKQSRLKCLTYFNERGCCDKFTCVQASEAGSVECLRYLLENGCPHDFEEITYQAYRNNHLECLQLALEKGCPLSEDVCRNLQVFAADERDGYNACQTYVLTNYAHRINR